MIQLFSYWTFSQALDFILLEFEKQFPFLLHFSAMFSPNPKDHKPKVILFICS